jgi:hypothetical protein
VHAREIGCDIGRMAAQAKERGRAQAGDADGVGHDIRSSD